ncbi:Hsp20/alpha crystallin family protein [Candidatus Parcubacteria bacterium]|nr:MAG: Hsp20/alpha crystallin family protein [Candidatus Parcubacteria bacterium]
MSLIPWSPFLDTFESLEKGWQNFIPAMDVYEEKDNVVVEATLAGIKPEDVDIKVHDDVLTIEGQRQTSSEIDEKNYYRKEVRSGSFHRSIVLPTSVQADKAQAEFENGLLKIVLPKEEKEQARSIKINVNNKK